MWEKKVRFAFRMMIGMDNLFNDKLLKTVMYDALCVMRHVTIQKLVRYMTINCGFLVISGFPFRPVQLSFSFIDLYRRQYVNGCKFSKESRHTHRASSIEWYFFIFTLSRKKPNLQTLRKFSSFWNWWESSS